jgi:PAS domain S-box-containing protein
MHEDELRALVAENEALRARVAELERTIHEREGVSAMLESVLMAVPVFISNLDPDLNIRFLNRYQPGHSPETVVGTSVFAYVAEEDRAITHEHIDRARKSGQVVSYTLHKASGAHGAPASYVTRVAPVREPDGRVGACLAFMDISEEMRRERTLQEMQEKLTLALDATGLGLWSWDLVTKQCFWDERMRALHACDEAIAPETYIERVVHPDDREFLRHATENVAESGPFYETAYRIVRADGGTRWLLTVGRAVRDESGKSIKIMGGALDVTRQRELEEQLRNAQKMDALASLTAGVAHNFNNMLAVIIPVLELATQRAPALDQALLDEATHAAMRAAELVQQLMTFAGKRPTEKRVNSDIVSCVHTAVSICRRLFDTEICLDVEPLPGPLAIACDPGQLEQVLVNLLLNARDAIKQAQRPDGLVHVRMHRNDDQDSRASGTWVCIDVIDNGAGMSEAVLARLFEPFFTTKPTGKGTGLGLATSFAIAREHGGTLACVASSPKGTHFSLRLPLVVETAPSEPRRRVTAPIVRGTTVLVVDDDTAVRSAVRSSLRASAMLTYEAASGAEALELLKQQPQIQVVLIDRSMPGGDGEHYIERIRALAGQARVILFSGGVVEPEVARMADAVIAKPSAGSRLAAAIAQVLSRPVRSDSHT